MIQITSDAEDFPLAKEMFRLLHKHGYGESHIYERTYLRRDGRGSAGIFMSMIHPMPGDEHQRMQKSLLKKLRSIWGGIPRKGRMFNVHIAIGNETIVVEGAAEYRAMVTEEPVRIPVKAPPESKVTFEIDRPPLKMVIYEIPKPEEKVGEVPA